MKPLKFMASLAIALFVIHQGQEIWDTLYKDIAQSQHNQAIAELKAKENIRMYGNPRGPGL